MRTVPLGLAPSHGLLRGDLYTRWPTTMRIDQNGTTAGLQGSALYGRGYRYFVTARLLPWRICLDAGDDFFVIDKAFEEFLPFFG